MAIQSGVDSNSDLGLVDPQMSAMQRNKGKRGEREVVDMATILGHEAKRTWETAQGEHSECDVTINGKPYQVKRRKDFKFLYEAIEGVEGLFLRGDNREWLVVLPAYYYLIDLRRIDDRT